MIFPIKMLLIRIALGAIVFCVTFASVLAGWAYAQYHQDQALLKDFVTQKLELNSDKTEQIMAICDIQSNIGKCSALRLIFTKVKCAQVTSKLRNAPVSCKEMFVNFKGQVVCVQLMGYSEKSNLYLEVTLMRQYPLLNII